MINWSEIWTVTCLSTTSSCYPPSEIQSEAKTCHLPGADGFWRPLVTAAGGAVNFWFTALLIFLLIQSFHLVAILDFTNASEMKASHFAVTQKSQLMRKWGDIIRWGLHLTGCWCRSLARTTPGHLAIYWPCEVWQASQVANWSCVGMYLPQRTS